MYSMHLVKINETDKVTVVVTRTVESAAMFAGVERANEITVLKSIPLDDLKVDVDGKEVCLGDFFNSVSGLLTQFTAEDYLVDILTKLAQAIFKVGSDQAKSEVKASIGLQ